MSKYWYDARLFHEPSKDVKWAFEGKNIDHIADCGIRNGRHTNNNRIERLKGTMRKRAKVQRVLKSYETKVTEGLRIYYNFVKPPAVLGRKTPVRVTEITLKEGNSWLVLLRKSIQE